MFWGDSPTTGTGFGNVLKFIIKYLPRDQFQISVLGLGCDNSPHDLDYVIYPVKSSAEFDYKEETYQLIKTENPDVIFLLHDIWVIDNILDFFKEYNVFKISKVIAYIPVDATDHDPIWYRNVHLLSKLVVYNKFGQDVVKAVVPNEKTEIIEHGVDTSIFYNTSHTKSELRKILFGDAVELDKGFIFLNAGRNQQRKLQDISMRAFAEFAKNKTDVYLYMHCGYIDSNINILRLAKILGIDDKLIMTHHKPGLPNVPIEHLNLIYNFCDVGLNSGLGEGFGLPNAEHAAVGKPQIVPDHSALTELYADCGLLVPANIEVSLHTVTTTGKRILVKDMVEKMELIYSDKELYNKLALKSFEKFSSERYSWKYIAEKWIDLFDRVLNGEKDNSFFYFIHVYKNMGTTLYSQFPSLYNKRFYGQKTLEQWESDNNEKIKVKHDYKKPISIDHIRVDELVRLGILTQEDIKHRKFVALIREPISRFISICNFKNKTPGELIEEYKNKVTKLTQCNAISTIYPIDLTLILMEEKELIKNWFKEHNITLNLDVIKNPSKKVITSLTEEELEQIKEIFKDDFKLYKELKLSSGIQKIKGFSVC